MEHAKKFGAPESILYNYGHWSLLLKPTQHTLGAMVVINNDSTKINFSSLLSDESDQLRGVFSDIETKLKIFLGYDKINYLFLMMEDEFLHAHIIPRYQSERTFNGEVFKDFCWPYPYDLRQSNAVRRETFEKLSGTLSDLLRK